MPLDLLYRLPYPSPPRADVSDMRPCMCMCGTVTRNGSIGCSPGGKGMNKNSGRNWTKDKTGLLGDEPTPLRLWPQYEYIPHRPPRSWTQASAVSRMLVVATVFMSKQRAIKIVGKFVTNSWKRTTCLNIIARANLSFLLQNSFLTRLEPWISLRVWWNLRILSQKNKFKCIKYVDVESINITIYIINCNTKEIN